MMIDVYLVQVQLIVSNVMMFILCLTISLVVNKKKKKNYYLWYKYKIFKVWLKDNIIIQLKNNAVDAQIIVRIVLIRRIVFPALHIC